MKAIYKKELSSLYNTVIGWLFVAVVVLMTGLFFTFSNLMEGSPYISSALGGVIVVFFLAVPILTMRTLAEERRSKTDQLLLTSPLSVGKIVVGKFLALCTVFAISVLVVCVFPIILGLFGEIPIMENYLGILGFFLAGVLCISVGVFFSSLTENQIIAAVMSFGTLILGYFMTGIKNMISVSGNFFTDFLGIFDYPEKMAPFLNGIFDVKALVYYLSVTALLLFLTCQSVERRRWTVSSKNIKLGAFSLGVVAVAIAVAVVLNLAVAKLPSKYTELDMTTQKLYTLSDSSIELAKRVDKSINIYVIASEDRQDETLKKTINGYAEYSKNINIKYIDPNINPNFHRKYTDGAVTLNSLIIESGEKFRIVDYSEIYTSEMDYQTGQTSMTGYDGEGKVTSAISYLMGGKYPTVYQIQGHNESDIGSAFVDVLKKSNIELVNSTLLHIESIPNDVACVIVNAPQTDFSSDDADKLIKYLNEGGKAILTVGYTEAQLPNYERVLSEYGVKNTRRMIFEGDVNYYYRSPLYLIPNILDTQYTGGFISRARYVFAPYTMALQFDENAGGKGAFEPILVTENAYAKENPNTVENLNKEDGDLVGTFYVGAILNAQAAQAADEEGSEAKTSDGSECKIAFFATGEFLRDESDSLVSGGNSALFSNVINKQVENDMVATIPAKNFYFSAIFVDTGNSLLIAAVLTILIPISLLISGIAIWMKRRRV